MSSSGRVLGNFTLAMCSQECLKRDAVTARRRRVFVNACSGSERTSVVFHRRHVWMTVTCSSISTVGSGACAHQIMDVSEAVSIVAMI